MVKKKLSDKNEMLDEDIKIIADEEDELGGLSNSDVDSLMDDFDDTPIEDPFFDDTASAIRPIAITPIYKISGLPPSKEKEALKMLAEGCGIDDVVEMFGVARSDVSVSTVKR